ncbi:MAG: hypothetical protein IPL08_05680 [Saprospiraceae bacterium]|nr:hypothetical protein [Saprospiraceae bacterium]
MDPSSSCNPCNSTLIVYDGACNDGPDTFSPTNVAGCISNPSPLYPSAGLSEASCSNGIVCHNSQAGDMRFNFTSNGATSITQLKGDFLFPTSGNSSSCLSNFTFKIEYRKNGSLVQTSSAAIVMGVMTTITFTLNPSILLSNGDQFEVRIIGQPESSSCKLFELGGVTLYGCCNPCTVDAGSIGSSKEICYNTSAGTLTNNTSATGSGTVAYQWQRSTTGCSSGWSDISGATNATYAPGNLTQTTYYRRRARNTFNGQTCDAFSNCVTVTVNPQLILTIPNDEVCAGPNFIKTVQATGGTPGYTYNWCCS